MAGPSESELPVISSPTSTIGGRFNDLADWDKSSKISTSTTGRENSTSNSSSNASKISDESLDQLKDKLEECNTSV